MAHCETAVRRRFAAVPRTARRAHNQALFRQVNDYIAAANLRLDPDTAAEAEFICECDQLGCSQLLRLPLRDYALVRSATTMFVVLPGHEDLDHERVVADRGGCLIVRTNPGGEETRGGGESRAARRGSRRRTPPLPPREGEGRAQVPSLHRSR